MKLFILAFLALISAAGNPKPHLLVGQWSITARNEASLLQKKRFISTIYFSSSGQRAIISLSDRNGREKEELACTWNTEEKPDQKLLLFTTADGRNLVYSVERLAKDSLFLRMKPELSNPGFISGAQQLKFERIAGPPENMP